ncbi:MAG: hypothetical protein ACOY3I_09020 [Verrucomicrobiota bacterium]
MRTLRDTPNSSQHSIALIDMMRRKRNLRIKTPSFSLLSSVVIACGLFGLPCAGYAQCSAGGGCTPCDSQGGQQEGQPKQQMPNQELMQLLMMMMQMLQQMMQQAQQNQQNQQQESTPVDTSGLQQQIADLQQQIQDLLDEMDEKDEEAEELEKKAEALAKANEIILENYDKLTDTQKDQLQAAIAKIPGAESVRVNSDGSIKVDNITIHTDGTVS